MHAIQNADKKVSQKTPQARYYNMVEIYIIHIHIQICYDTILVLGPQRDDKGPRNK